MRRFWRQPPEHACAWRTRVEAACAEMGRQAAEGTQYVLIARVLQMLDPERKLAVPAPPPDPRADPLLGTLPVTAPEEDQAGGQAGS